MRQRVARLWSGLISSLMDCVGSDDKEGYFQAIAGWTIKHRRDFEPSIWHDYGLEMLANLRPRDYPIALSDQDVSDDIDRLSSMQPTSTDNIAMLLRDRLWNLVTFRSNVECPSCGDEDLRFLFAPSATPPSLILTCDQCAWTQFRDGREWDGPPTARPCDGCRTSRRRYHNMRGFVATLLNESMEMLGLRR